MKIVVSMSLLSLWIICTGCATAVENSPRAVKDGLYLDKATRCVETRVIECPGDVEEESVPGPTLSEE